MRCDYCQGRFKSWREGDDPLGRYCIEFWSQFIIKRSIRSTSRIVHFYAPCLSCQSTRNSAMLRMFYLYVVFIGISSTFWNQRRDFFLFKSFQRILALANHHSKIVFGNIQICHQHLKNSLLADFSQTQEALRIEIRSLAITGKPAHTQWITWRLSFAVQKL